MSPTEELIEVHNQLGKGNLLPIKVPLKTRLIIKIGSEAFKTQKSQHLSVQGLVSIVIGEPGINIKACSMELK